MEVQCDISLQRIACNSVAAAIWDKELNNMKTQEIFYSGKHLENKQKWYDLVKDVIKKINQDLLHAILYQELLSAVMYLGLRIFGWFEHLREIFGSFGEEISRKDLFENYVKKIYWTHYGTIDELKIFKLFWLNNPNVDICKMYNMACMYCLKEEVEAFWGKISSTDQIKFYQNYDVKDHDLNILLYWKNYRNPSDSFISELLLVCNPDVKSIYDANQSVEENMLKLCALNGNHIGFKYFWNLLVDDKKKNYAVICLKIILENPSCYNYDNKFVFAYFEDRFYEILTFLVQNEPEEVATYLSVQYDGSGIPRWRILDIIECLPWRELLFRVLDHALHCCKKKNLCELISKFVTVLKRENEFHLPIKNSGLQRKLRQIWHIAPSEYKFKCVNSLIYDLLEVWDLSTIKFILNDNDLMEHRESILKKIVKVFTFIEINKVEQIFCELLIPRDLKENDQSLLKTICKLFLHKDLNFLNECIFDDNAKRNLKNELAFEFIVYFYLKNHELDLADKFLVLMLESTEEINDFKKRLENDEFARDQILDIWSTAKEDFESAVSRSNAFLSWLVNYSEEENCKFKVKTFKEVDHDKLIVRLIFELDEIQIINQFLVWSLWTEAEIKEFMEILVPKKNYISSFIKPERERSKFDKCSLLVIL